MVLEFWLNHFTGLDFVQVRKGVFMKESWTSLGFEPCTFIYPGKYSTIKIMRPLVLKTCGHSPLFTTTISRLIVVLGWCIFKACKLVCAPKYTTNGITSLLVNWQLFNHTSVVAIHSGPIKSMSQPMSFKLTHTRYMSRTPQILSVERKIYAVFSLT